MGSNGGDQSNVPRNDAGDCSGTTVEIKIKTLDSQTFTLRVDKYVPVPELKEQIASVTGVVSQQQRLICRGKVLKDDQLLSAYHVEDGHTLHLVERQGVPPSPEPATDPTLGSEPNPGNETSPGMVIGTFNITEAGDGAFPDINRIVSAVLNSFGVTGFGNGGEGIQINQTPSTVPVQQPDQSASRSVPVESPQPQIIPDSLTTLTQYLSHLRQEFASNGFSQIAAQGSTHSAESRGVLTPEFLAEVMTSSRQLLVEQATQCLSQLARELDRHSNVTDPLERSRIQSNAIRSGALFQNLGSLLLELGRAIMTLRMGQNPAEAMVNAGPSVFVSSTGPNPIMVQPLPFQPGASFGSVPVGTAQNGSGLSSGPVASGFRPRNIDIRIRTGSVFSRRGDTTTGSEQAPVQGAPPVSSNGVNSGQQTGPGLDPSSQNREPQLRRAIPIRTVVGAVPAAVSVGRSSDPSRGSVGILYPVLTRVQQGSSNGTRDSQPSDQNQNANANTEQVTPDSATQGGNGSLNAAIAAAFNAVDGFTGDVQRSLEQYMRSMFQGGNVNAEPQIIHTTAQAQQPPAQQPSASASASATVTDEGIRLSNILRQIMPMIIEGQNSTERQGDENQEEEEPAGPESRHIPKRQRRE